MSLSSKTLHFDAKHPMQMDRDIIAKHTTLVHEWRQDYARISNELDRSKEKIFELDQNLALNEEYLNLLAELKKTGNKLLDNLNTLSDLKEKNNIDEVFYQLCSTLSESKLDHSKLLEKYQLTLDVINDQLASCQKLEKILIIYQEILRELKKYCSKDELKVYQTFVQACKKWLDDHMNSLSHSIKELSDQHPLIIKKQVRLSQIKLFIENLEKKREIHQQYSKVFYLLDSSEVIKDINDKNIEQSLQKMSLLKKSALNFHSAFKNYLDCISEINLDQKFYQFFHNMKVLEKKLTDLKDENIDDDYETIFNTLLEASQRQLTETLRMEKTFRIYANKFTEFKQLSSKLEGDGLIQAFSSLFERHVSSLTSLNEQLIIGKIERENTSVKNFQQKMQAWVHKIDRQLTKADLLSKKIEERNLYFEEMEKELKDKNILSALKNFPKFHELYTKTQSLASSMSNYKKSLIHLQKQIQKHTSELHSKIIKSRIDINLKKDLKNTSSALIKEYSKILDIAVKIEKEMDDFEQIILKNKKLNGPEDLPQETILCTEIQERIKSDIKHFDACYRKLTLETTPNFQEEQKRIMRVNQLLQNIYHHFTIIEKELLKKGYNANGIIVFKEQFAPVLLFNTVHEEDLENTVKQYLEWLYQIEKNDHIYLDAKSSLQAIQSCRHQFVQLKDELSRWRVATMSYVLSTGMRIFSPAFSAMLSIVLPGIDLVSNSLPDVVGNGIKSAVQLSGEKAYSSVTDNLSPTERDIDFDETKKLTRDIQKKFSLAGVPQVVAKPDDTKIQLSLDTRHLWCDVWYANILKTIYNKSMILTGISGSISLAFALTGFAAPLALGLLGGSTASCALIMAAYDEYQARGKEAEIRFAKEERVKKIDEEIQLLNIDSTPRAFNKYYAETMHFIRDIVTQMQIHLKDDENNDTAKYCVSQMLEYLDKIEITKKSPIETPVNSGLHLEFKRSILLPLHDFLKTEAEGKNSLTTSIQLLNSIPLNDEKTIAKQAKVLRIQISRLEEIFKTLHAHCAIGISPLQNKIEILDKQLASNLAINDRLFKSSLKPRLLKIKEHIALLTDPDVKPSTRLKV